jgi:hypothetical protein
MKISAFDIIIIIIGILFLKAFYGFLKDEWKAKKEDENRRRQVPRLPSDYFTNKKDQCHN